MQVEWNERGSMADYGKTTDVLVCKEPALHTTQPQGDAFQSTCE